MNEYYIYNLNGTCLFIYRKGNYDTIERKVQWLESREFFSGLECNVSIKGVEFFNGRLVLPFKKLDPVTEHEFIEEGTAYLDKSEEYGESIKSKLNELLNAKYEEISKNEEMTYKIIDYKAYNNKMNSRKRMYSRNR